MIWLLAGYMLLFIERPFEVWPILATFRLERVYMIATIVAWLASDGPKSIVPGRLIPAFAFMIAVVMLSWVMSPYPEDCRLTAENYLKAVVFCVLVITTVRDESQLRRLIWLYLVVTFLYMSHSLWEYTCGRYVYRMGIVRLIGIDSYLGNPNSFAATICYSLPFLFPYWRSASTYRDRILLLSYVAMSVICVLLTGSRSGLVVLLALAAIPVFMTRRRILWASMVLCVSLTAWWNLPVDLQERFVTIVDPSQGPTSARQSAEMRKMGWRDGVRIWKKHSFVGVGPGAFPAARGFESQAHHLYGQVLGEVGTLGAIALLLIVLGFGRNYLESRRIEKEHGPTAKCFSGDVSRAAMVAVFVLLVSGFGSHNLYRYNWLWFGAFQTIALYAMRNGVVEWRFAPAVSTAVPRNRPSDESDAAVPVI